MPSLGYFRDSNLILLEFQGKDAEEVIKEKDRQLAVVQEELKAIKFDLATRQLEKEKENQVEINLEQKETAINRMVVIIYP